MTDVPGGLLRTESGRVGVRFERRCATTPDDLWSAMTEPERLRRWFAPVSGELRVGGRYRVDFDAEGSASGIVRRCEPPRALEVTWEVPGEPDSRVLVEVHEDAAGSLLVLDHSHLPRSSAAGYSAGWEAYLEALDAGLGRSGASPAADWDVRWRELLAVYAPAVSALPVEERGSG